MELKDVFTIVVSGVAAFIGAWSKFGIEILRRRMTRKNIAQQFAVAPFDEKRIVVKILKGQIDFDPDLITVTSLERRGIIFSTVKNYGGQFRYSLTPLFLDIVEKKNRSGHGDTACNKAIDRIKKFFVR